MSRHSIVVFLAATACAPKSTTTPENPPAPTTAADDATPPGDPPTDTGATPSDTDTSAPCDKSECGPAMGMPNSTCPDGKTIAGPACTRDAEGKCGYRIVECPK